MQHDKIEVPNNYYDEPILFTHPEELMAIFEAHEQSNLEKIQQSQNLEESLEQEKQREIEVKLSLGREIATQEENKRKIEANIKRA